MSEENNEKDSFDFQENEDDDYSEIDEDRPTLLQINKKIEKERKKENKILMQKKRARENVKTDIIYDANKKKIINFFCPDPEELSVFLEKCEIREIEDESALNEIPKENIFDPEQFLKENYKKEECKSFISIEDLTLVANKKKLEYPEQLNVIEEEPYIAKPQIENKTELINSILNSEILDLKQKAELNKLISEIKKMKVNDIIKKDKKLEIVFDLDNTCILGFTVNNEQRKELEKKFSHKNLKFISFNYDRKVLICCLIIRNGLYEFLEYAKPFCNFYISTLGIESYGIKIMFLLEEKMDVKFIRFKGRRDIKCKKEQKSLKDLELNSKNTIIFDDKPLVWTYDYLNVILSKKFTDKDIEDYLPKNNYNNENEKMRFLFNYFPFYFYRSGKNNFKQILWKNQKLFGGRQCPFYKYTPKKDLINNDNDCYSGEYLESLKYQFNYMSDVIKIIYYFVFYYDIHVSDALKLIRYNIFYKSYFSLTFYRGEGKEILIDIIENCGGEIYKEKNDNNEKINGTLYFVCRKDDYPSLKDKIKKELIIYENSKLVNEKYVLDSFYFLTNLENNLNDYEYCVNNENINEQDDYDNY